MRSAIALFFVAGLGTAHADLTTGRDKLVSGDYKTAIAELTKALLLRFFEFDLEFPGGSWDELGRAIRERLIAAYAQQKPEFLKAELPDALRQ